MSGQMQFGIPGSLGFVSETTKERARAAVSKAIRQGDLVRPKVCSVCGRRRKKILAHHDDYNKPLAVRWMCTKCHGQVHRFDRAPAHKRRKGKRFQVSLSPAERRHVMAYGYARFGQIYQGATMLRVLLLELTGFDPDLCGK